MQVNKVLLASPHGFCAGVEMAIKALAWMTNIFEPPIYCYHQIVHNQQVVSRFEDLGVVFVDDIADVPRGAPLMLSAHGSAPSVAEQAARNLGIKVDAVCPLVTKVHHEAKLRSDKGFSIIYVGHAGHDEAVGTVAVAPESIHLVETEQDLSDLPAIEGPVALLAQTTLSHDEWSAVLDAARLRYPDVWTPGRSDLCFATTNRQAALKAVVPRVDTMVVIGSDNSSNTIALVKVATAAGCERVLRISNVDELPDDLSGNVGVTAGASAPEGLIREVIERLAPTEIEEVTVTEEQEYFPLPRELREMLRSLTSLAAAAFGGPLPTEDVLDQERNVRASDVLEAIAS